MTGSGNFQFFNLQPVMGIGWLRLQGHQQSRRRQSMTNQTGINTDAANTTIIVAKTRKSVIAAFFLTFLFGPLGLLYASIGGGIFLIIVAAIVVPLTAGLAFFIVWPIAMIWGVLSALASKSGDKIPD
jgi:hypothetical protein